MDMDVCMYVFSINSRQLSLLVHYDMKNAYGKLTGTRTIVLIFTTNTGTNKHYKN